MITLSARTAQNYKKSNHRIIRKTGLYLFERIRAEATFKQRCYIEFWSKWGVYVRRRSTFRSKWNVYVRTRSTFRSKWNVNVHRRSTFRSKWGVNVRRRSISFWDLIRTLISRISRIFFYINIVLPQIFFLKIHADPEILFPKIHADP